MPASAPETQFVDPKQLRQNTSAAKVFHTDGEKETTEDREQYPATLPCPPR